MSVRRSAAMLALWALAGCQAFVETDATAIAPGTAVRVTLERDEALRQADVLGGLETAVQGRVNERTDGTTLALAVSGRGASASDGSRFSAFVQIPWAGISRIEEKRFSPVRTAALAAVGAVVTVLVLQLTDESAGGEGEPGGPNNQLRVPILRIGW
jgi:hypothetical protein